MEHLSKNKIKWIRSLRLKKNRDAESVFIVEGHKMVMEILNQWSDLIVCICTTDTSANGTKDSYLVDEKTMKELSTLKTPSSYLAVVRKPEFKSEEVNFILVLDGIQDPGNMGTIIRTADWFGVDKIVCSTETVDVFNSKVIQSSMGSLFRIPVEYTDIESFLSSASLPVYGALLEGKNVYETELEKNAILVIGNEGNGISPEIRRCITHPILIPGKGGAESLNASVATGILLSLFSA